MATGLTPVPSDQRRTPNPQEVSRTDDGSTIRGENRAGRCGIFRIGAFALAIFVVVLLPLGSVYAQGFGNGKKKVTLRRRLPAAVHFSGTGFDVKITPRQASYADIAQSLTDLLPTELVKNDPKLHVEKTAPDLVVTCTVTSFETPPPQTFSRNEVVFQKGHNVEEPKQFYKVTGTLAIAYQAREGKSQRVIDSQNLESKYSQDFEAGTNAAANESAGSKMVDPFKRLAGKKTDETATAPTPLALRNILISRVISQVASRLVNTDEVIEVPLARGKLDESDKLAESGLWSRYLETLETMPPFADRSEDAYRVYNIAVGYEAEAYASEDHAAAKKLLEQAAINYGKALDGKPTEKNFIEPQGRIETAIEHYKLLNAPAVAEAPPPAPAAPSPAAPSSPAATAPAKTSTRSTHSASSGTHNGSTGSTSGGSGSATKTSGTSSAGGSGTAGAKSAAPAKPAMSNADVIKMAKAGVDEDSIVGAIKDAPSAQFDLSPDGLISLAQNGVKGKIVTAMRERAKTSRRAAAPSN